MCKPLRVGGRHRPPMLLEMLCAIVLAAAASGGFVASASAAPTILSPNVVRIAQGAVVAFPGALEPTGDTIEVEDAGTHTKATSFKLLHADASGVIVQVELSTSVGTYELYVKDAEGTSEPLPFSVVAPTVAGQTIKPLGSATESSLPLGVAEGPHGEVWFSNAAANVIGELTIGGEVKEYKLPAENSHPTGIAVDQAGNVWVADNGIGAVSELEVAHAAAGTANGVSDFPLATGAQPDQLSVDPYGNVWVAEGDGVLGEITAGSHQTREWLISEGGDLEGMVVDSFGNVWAVDESSGVDQIVPSQLPAPSTTTAAATGVYHVANGGGTEQIAAAPNGDIWFTEWGPAKLGLIVPSTTSPSEDQVAYAADYPTPPGEAPSGIGIDAAGNVFVEDAAAQAIYEFSPTGAPASGSVPGAWKESQVGSWITNYSEGDEGNNLAVLPSGDVVFSGYVTYQGGSGTPFEATEFIQGYLGRLPGVATPATSTGKTIIGGKTTEEVVSGTSGDEVIVPAGTEVLTSAGTPFEGTLPPPVSDKSLIPGGTALFGDLVGGSAFSVSPELSDGVLSHLTFSKPVTVVFSFPLPAGVSAKEAEEAKLYYYNFATLAWEEAGSECGDPGGKTTVSGGTVTITLLTEHLSAFAAFHHPPAAAPPPPPTSPPKVKLAPRVNPKTGDIEAEYEFPEAGEAEAYGEVTQGASIARVQPSSLLAFAASSSDGGAWQQQAQAAARHGKRHHHHAKGKRCKRGDVRHGKRCVSNAPVHYGQVTLKAPAAGTYKIRIKATGKVLVALRRGRTIAVKFVLVFTPAGTTDHIAETATVKVHLERKKHKRQSKHKKHKKHKK
jgi:streptogramin lyase